MLSIDTLLSANCVRRDSNPHRTHPGTLVRKRPSYQLQITHTPTSLLTRRHCTPPSFFAFGCHKCDSRAIPQIVQTPEGVSQRLQGISKQFRETWHVQRSARTFNASIHTRGLSAGVLAVTATADRRANSRRRPSASYVASSAPSRRTCSPDAARRRPCADNADTTRPTPAP